MATPTDPAALAAFVLWPKVMVLVLLMPLGDMAGLAGAVHRRISGLERAGVGRERAQPGLCRRRAALGVDRPARRVGGDRPRENGRRARHRRRRDPRRDVQPRRPHRRGPPGSARDRPPGARPAPDRSALGRGPGRPGGDLVPVGRADGHPRPARLRAGRLGPGQCAGAQRLSEQYGFFLQPLAGGRPRGAAGQQFSCGRAGANRQPGARCTGPGPAFRGDRHGPYRGRAVHRFAARFVQ